VNVQDVTASSLQPFVNRGVRKDVPSCNGGVNLMRLMYIICFAFVTAMSTLLGGCAASAHLSSAAALTERHDAYVRAMNDNDFDSVVSFASAEIVRKPPHEPAHHGREAYRAWLGGVERIVHYHLSREVVEVRTDLAYIRGAYSITLRLPEIGEITDGGQYIELWRREDDGVWYIREAMWNSSHPPRQ
jgi:ketosteroid isomerase-like protein